MTGGRGLTMTDAAARLAVRRGRGLRPGARTAGLACALAAAWLVLPPGTAGAAGAGRAGPATAGPGDTVLAWGANFFGELGDGTTIGSSMPSPVKLPRGYRYSTVRGQLYSLALTTSGRIFTWGDNNSGQLGDGTTKRRLKPVRVLLPRGVKVTAVRAGADFVLALTSTGKLLAWGDNRTGELGNGSTKSRLKPAAVRLPRGVRITAISAGDGSALALTAAGGVLAWGGNQGGQLGDGTTTDRHVPVRVRLPKGAKVRALAAGKYFSFALTAGGRILAWGDNTNGQLGTDFDSLHQSDVPVRVKLPAGFTPTAIGGGTSAGTALAIGREPRD